MDQESTAAIANARA